MNTATPSSDVHKIDKILSKITFSTSVSVDQKQALFDLISDYEVIFYIDGDKLGCYNGIKHTCNIDTGNASPVRCCAYRYTPPKQILIRDHVNKLLSQGLIYPTCSPWSVPVVLVKKKMVVPDFA